MVARYRAGNRLLEADVEKRALAPWPSASLTSPHRPARFSAIPPTYFLGGRHLQYRLPQQRSLTWQHKGGTLNSHRKLIKSPTLTPITSRVMSDAEFIRLHDHAPYFLTSGQAFPSRTCCTRRWESSVRRTRAGAGRTTRCPMAAGTWCLTTMTPTN